jgi:hypothetical protein
VAGGWRRQHNEELHTLYASLIIIKVIRSREKRWSGHVACIGEMHTIFLLENFKGRDRLEDLGINERIMIILSYGIKMGSSGLNSSGSG